MERGAIVKQSDYDRCIGAICKAADDLTELDPSYMQFSEDAVLAKIHSKLKAIVKNVNKIATSAGFAEFTDQPEVVIMKGGAKP